MRARLWARVVRHSLYHIYLLTEPHTHSLIYFHSTHTQQKSKKKIILKHKLEKRKKRYVFDHYADTTEDRGNSDGYGARSISVRVVRLSTDHSVTDASSVSSTHIGYVYRLLLRHKIFLWKQTKHLSKYKARLLRPELPPRDDGLVWWSKQCFKDWKCAALASTPIEKPSYKSIREKGEYSTNRCNVKTGLNTYSKV